MKSIFLGLCLSVCPAALFADCGMTANMKAHLSFSSASVNAMTISPAPSARTSDWDNAKVTGLWHIKFTSGGQVFDEGFDAWHSDGLEILNDTPPPSTGNVCLGVYTQIGPRSFKLKHPSWVYDDANINVIGIATIYEAVTLSRSSNSFSGTFKVNVVDLFGNPLGEADGTITATRITAN